MCQLHCLADFNSNINKFYVRKNLTEFFHITQCIIKYLAVLCWRFKTANQGSVLHVFKTPIQTRFPKKYFQIYRQAVRKFAVNFSLCIKS